VVFDSSTLVGGALRRESPPRLALLEALGHCDVCASAESLAELEEVLERSKFDRYLDLEKRRAFVSRFRKDVRLFVVGEDKAAEVKPLCRDPNDNKFLALALAAEADMIVSSDEDLLVLHPWKGISISKPTEFLASISSFRP
jgi:putative PIN family toxin of toxin-antitoxin system